MRVSVDQDDSGFTLDAYKYMVRLDGELLKACITADEEEGSVLIYAQKGDDFVIDPDDPNQFITETKRGLVEIFEIEDN